MQKLVNVRENELFLTWKLRQAPCNTPADLLSVYLCKESLTPVISDSLVTARSAHFHH